MYAKVVHSEDIVQHLSDYDRQHEQRKLRSISLTVYFS